MVATTTTAAADVTVRGVVGSVSASARVVTLASPVSGFATVALNADAQVRRADGAAVDLGAIVPGTTVEAVGRPGSPGTLIARRLTLL